MDEFFFFFKNIYGAVTKRFGGSAAVALAVVFLGGGAIIAGVFFALSRDIAETGPAEGQLFEIGTGAVTGTYYPLGNTLASIISNPTGSVRCADQTQCGPPGLTPIVQATDGSVANVNAVHRGRLDSAFAQSNVLNQAWTGAVPFAYPLEDLRAISGLYQEMVHLVVARGSDIETVADLRGARVSIDREGSGTHGIAQMILEAAGLSGRDVEIITTPADQSAEMLLSGELDAFFFVAGPPVRAVGGLADLHLIDLVPIDGAAISALIESQPFLVASEIPMGSYTEIIAATPTIGVTAVWIVHESADFDLVYQITRALWNGANKRLLNAGPAQAQSMMASAAFDGVPIPFHSGAEAYYREAGLLTEDE